VAGGGALHSARARHGGKVGWIQDKRAGPVEHEAVAQTEPVICGVDAHTILGREVQHIVGAGRIGWTEHERVCARAAGQRVLPESSGQHIGGGVADEHVRQVVARRVDGG
jgi:hypothetical protein